MDHNAAGGTGGHANNAHSMPPGDKAASAGSGGVLSTGGAGGDLGSTDCAPTAESCDGQDNDCDGRIDEELTRSCGIGQPPCRKGVQTCQSGQWSSECVGEIKPTPDICDGIDNDCDGAPDTGCECVTGTKMSCGIGIAPCKKGTRTCTDGAWPTTCDGSVEPTDEICDGIDNDCNGDKDEEGDTLCKGETHCLGSQGCVDCTNDAHCNGEAASTCKVNYCNVSTHRCDEKNAQIRASCNGSSKCTSDGRCVECIGNDCPSGKTCDSHNMCIKVQSCGDGIIDSGEACDNGTKNSNNSDCRSDCQRNVCGDKHWNTDGTRPEACDLGDRSSFSDGHPWDEYSCTTACIRRWDYTPCQSDDDCGDNLCLNGRCYTSCGSNLGQACTTESGKRGVCVLGNPGKYPCAVICNTAGDTNSCPWGSECTASAIKDPNNASATVNVCL